MSASTSSTSSYYGIGDVPPELLDSEILEHPPGEIKPEADPTTYFKEIKLVLISGPPFSGRSKIAIEVAGWLGCPLLSLEAILEGSTTLGPPRSPEDEFNLIETALRILFHQASNQAKAMLLEGGRRRGRRACCVVLDFPLSSPSHLELLLQSIMSVVDDRNIVPHSDQVLVRLLIIHCCAVNLPGEIRKLGDPYGMAWNRSLFKKAREAYRGVKWYHQVVADDDDPIFTKAKKLILPLRKYDLDNICHHEPRLRLSVLMIDPKYYLRVKRSTISTDNIGKDPPTSEYGTMFYQVLHFLLFIYSISRQKRPIAVHYLYLAQYLKQQIHLRPETSCFKGENNHILILWTFPSMAYSRFRRTPKSSATTGEFFQICYSCRRKLHPQDRYYYCQDCRQGVHRKCAEMSCVGIEHLVRPLDTNLSDKASACTSCLEAHGNDAQFSLQCKSCIFETNLTRHLWPTIVHHPCHPQHFLQIYVLDDHQQQQIGSTIPSCAACGRAIEISTTPICYSCTECNLLFGFSCATQLYTIKWKHFGHDHPLQLRSSPYEELDYYICHICSEEFDPHKHWHYFCQECDFWAHVYCTDPHHHLCH